MKCICPMGGNRTCPDDCFIAVWHKLPDDQKTKERRRPIVEQLHKQHYPQEQIARQLDVGVGTVNRDIATFSIAENVRYHGRDALGRHKNQGRKKGTKANGAQRPARRKGHAVAQDKAQAAVRTAILTNDPTPTKKLAQQLGVSNDTIERLAIGERERLNVLYELNVDPKTLSMSAQTKLEVAKRIVQREGDARIAERERKLDEEIRQRVLKETEEYLAMLKTRQEKADKTVALYTEFMNNNKPLFTSEQFKLILMCLHPDGQRTSEKLAEAFRLFNAKKLQLTGQR